MTNKIGDHWDYNIRQWTLDSAINANKKGTCADKIVSDAQKFYGYIFPENGRVESISDKKTENAKK